MLPAAKTVNAVFHKNFAALKSRPADGPARSPQTIPIPTRHLGARASGRKATARRMSRSMRSRRSRCSTTTWPRALPGLTTGWRFLATPIPHFLVEIVRCPEVKQPTIELFIPQPARSARSTRTRAVLPHQLHALSPAEHEQFLKDQVVCDKNSGACREGAC